MAAEVRLCSYTWHNIMGNLPTLCILLVLPAMHDVSSLGSQAFPVAHVLIMRWRETFEIGEGLG